MNKKGFELSWISWLMGILFVFILLFVITQRAKVGEFLAFSFGSGVLPEETPPELFGEFEIPPSLKSDFDVLVSNINNAKYTGPCLVYASELRIEKGWFIRLSENKAELFRESDKGLPIAKESKSLNKFKPCELKDDSAVKFYNCYLKGQKPCIALSPRQEPVEFRKGEEFNFLYKVGENFCKFKFYNDPLNIGCGFPRNLGEDGIDNDCTDDIKDEVAIRCDETGIPQKLGQPEKGIYKYDTRKSTPIYYRYINGAWQWTPYTPSTNIWMPVTTTIVSGGNWNGQQPTQANIDIINYLAKNNPAP